jgi:hypothetical protein
MYFASGFGKFLSMTDWPHGFGPVESRSARWSKTAYLMAGKLKREKGRGCDPTIPFKGMLPMAQGPLTGS